MVQGLEIPECGNLGPETVKNAQVCDENCMTDRLTGGNTEDGPVLEKMLSSMPENSGAGSHSLTEERFAQERGNPVPDAYSRPGPTGQGILWLWSSGRMGGRGGS